MTKAKYEAEDIARWQAKIATGKSKRQIAIEEGISPGALIGAMHRASGGTKTPRGVNWRARPRADKEPKNPRGRPRNPVRPDMLRPDQDGPDIIALEPGRCKFPVTQYRPHKFCGEKANGPYCRKHHELTHDNSTQNAARFDNAVKWITAAGH